MKYFLLLVLILLLSLFVHASPVQSVKEVFVVDSGSCTSYQSAVTYKRELNGVVVNGSTVTEIILTITNSQNVTLHDLVVDEELPDELDGFLVDGNQSLNWVFDQIRPNEKKVIKYGVKKELSERDLELFSEPKISIEEPTPIKRITGIRVTTAITALLLLSLLSTLHLHIIKKSIKTKE